MTRNGLLLLNLGTPDSPAPRDVRPYLREFLSDPRVLDMNAIGRWLLLNLIILPTRPKASGEAYAEIWTDEGSPLLLYTQELADKVRKRLGDEVHVEIGMRYGNPSIASALQRFRDAAVDRIVLMPLYPQYSSAANGSSLEKVYREAARGWNVPALQVVPQFHAHPAFLDALADVTRPHLDLDKVEKVYLSFHGVPERHCTKSDDTGAHCLKRDDCCAVIVDANRNCYRAHCFATARALSDRLQIPEDKRVVCFQSRLGRTPWIKPYTDVILEEDARAGIKHAAILSPAFVADCLETIEELGMRAVETWQENGGESLTLIPCLNAADVWVDALIKIVRDNSAWIPRPAHT